MEKSVREEDVVELPNVKAFVRFSGYVHGQLVRTRYSHRITGLPFTGPI